MEQDYLLIYNKYHSFLENLSSLAKETENRVIANSDNLFVNNVNFFSRSYLLNLCTYLEAYLTEIATNLFKRHCECINLYSVPKSFMLASLSSWEPSKKSQDIEKYQLSYDKRNIKKFFNENKISGNLDKTFNAFKVLGIELDNQIKEQSIKDRISTIVNKRNDVIHRNDDVIDVSLSDIESYITTVDDYMQLIMNIVTQSEYKAFKTQ